MLLMTASSGIALHRFSFSRCWGLVEQASVLEHATPMLAANGRQQPHVGLAESALALVVLKAIHAEHPVAADDLAPRRWTRLESVPGSVRRCRGSTPSARVPTTSTGVH